MKLAALKAISLVAFSMMAKAAPLEGWQFKSFIGEYNVVQPAACPVLSGTVTVGYLYSKDFPSIEIRPRFSSVPKLTEHLRNNSTHGEECYECDPYWWNSTVIGGDGIKNATYENSGITPYSHSPYATSIEMIRAEQERVYIKLGECVAELAKQ